MTRSTARSGREGMTTSLFGILALLALLGLAAIAHLGLSSESLGLATQGAAGAVAEELATSAVEEATWRFQRLVSDPRHPFFFKVRREIAWDRQPYVDLSSDLEPRLLQARLKAPDREQVLRYAMIEHFKAILHVPGQGRESMIDLDCGVSLRVGGTSVFRRVCDRRRYGVAHVSPPKPFDQFTLAIIEHGYLEILPEHLDAVDTWLQGFNVVAQRLAWLREIARDPTLPQDPSMHSVAPTAAVTRAADGSIAAAEFPPPLLPASRPPRLPERVRALAQEAVDRKARDDPQFRALLERLTEDERAWVAYRLVAHHPAAQVRLRITPIRLPDVRTFWAPIPDSSLDRNLPPSDAIVYSLGATTRLEDFDYEPRYQTAIQEVRTELERQSVAFNQAWMDLVGRGEVVFDQSMANRLVRGVEPFSRPIRSHVSWWIEAFDKVVRHIKAHTRDGFTSHAHEEYLRQCSHRLKPIAYHVQTQRQLDELFVRYPVFNGHVSLAGTGDRSLGLEGFSGKAIVSRPSARTVRERHALHVKGLTVKDPTRDLVVLDADEVRLGTNAVHASVFAGERFCVQGDGATIHGNLVIRRLQALKDRIPGEALKGTVTYNPLVFSGPFQENLSTSRPPDGILLDRYVVTVCPRGLERTVIRSRGQEVEP